MNIWILKTEPEVYSVFLLQKEKKTWWNGIRNYQARNYLKKMKKGDHAFIYHTSQERKVVGLGIVLQEWEPELPLVHPVKPGDWVQVEIGFLQLCGISVPLSEIKKEPCFQTSFLIKQGRLSVVPLTMVQAERLRVLCQV